MAVREPCAAATDVCGRFSIVQVGGITGLHNAAQVLGVVLDSNGQP
jgi:hypothetical protein